LLRAGIQNVWEYDDQRFVFHRGRLLLRGQNESGKTKALEVLLPFLLDADLQPQRLDPFGSTARPMRWNLLNDANPDVSVAIGYVWLELGRLDDGAPLFCTVGAGLRAKRSVPGVEDWYFLSSQRVDVDLRLYDENRVPVTRAALGEALVGGGQLFDRASDYRRAVNHRLFGMPIEQYSSLLDALLQLRRPQLSKLLDPAELSRILSASLPPLDTAVVGTLAEGFERLDRHRAEREELAGTLSGLRAFLDVYRGYVASFVKSRALDLTRAESAYHASRAALRQGEERQQSTARRQLELAETLVQLQREGDALEERIRTLRESDEYRAVRDWMRRSLERRRTASMPSSCVPRQRQRATARRPSAARCRKRRPRPRRRAGKRVAQASPRGRAQPRRCWIRSTWRWSRRSSVVTSEGRTGRSPPPSGCASRPWPRSPPTPGESPRRRRAWIAPPTDSPPQMTVRVARRPSSRRRNPKRPQPAVASSRTSPPGRKVCAFFP